MSEIETRFKHLSIGEDFNLNPHEQYGWNAWTRTREGRDTNARKGNDFRGFKNNMPVYVRVHGKRLKQHREKLSNE